MWLALTPLRQFKAFDEQVQVRRQRLGYQRGPHPLKVARNRELDIVVDSGVGEGARMLLFHCCLQ
jgi:hypothetical protein